ncbi:diguanylate cyclase (GGDEF)-like protein [Blastococcus saxobsidens]|uniref:Diguanylate cyclase (GGDEF)-like protein n=1 Tax=Blastococcus saxobsidens TaxID=138336 RepID=A0A4Q7Y7B3_9ACTN|nr:GGDEF domain-containing protein [Blastococcus saxobsidens]RZU31845.1 diguanylate cyclase (GGDEF)-like protein [Blastococcus saxobsidens]
MTSVAERPGEECDSVVPASATRDLGAVVDDLEIVSRFERDDVEVLAERALGRARELGLAELEKRAGLVLADRLRRRGNVAEAGRRAQETLRWAVEHGAGHLQARAHHLLAGAFQELGDLSQALEHAVRAADMLADDAPHQLRIDHHARLADCLGLNGDLVARERYDHVLALAEEIGDVERQVLVLNNRTYCETISGHYDEALVWSARLQEVSARHGVPLRAGRLDTIGRALMELGRLEDAEAAMLPGLHPEVLDASLDGDAGADFLLTLAELRRRRGNLAGAQENLDECVRRCERHGLTSIRVRARREQAELHAAAGRYRHAFEEHKLFTDEFMELQSADRDARARALQAMYETAEARRQTRRYRELSLRDPLTGLYNRRFVDDELPRVLGEPAAAAGSVTVALLDLDHFKRINDTCSHEIGDRVLRAVAQLLVETDPANADSAYAGSFVARLGGEEFLLVVAGLAPGAAVRHLEEVRRTVAAQPWDELTGDLPVTVSIGAASTDGLDSPAASDMLARADARLYTAKRQGRDRVVSEAG